MNERRCERREVLRSFRWIFGRTDRLAPNPREYGRRVIRGADFPVRLEREEPRARIREPEGGPHPRDFAFDGRLEARQARREREMSHNMRTIADSTPRS